jgi:hypothetical protein
MNLSDKYPFTPRYRGKVLSASIMLAYYLIAFVVLMSYGASVGAFSKYDKPDTQLVAGNSSKVLKDNSTVGLVKGIVYNPPNSCAVVDETIMHVGDTIHEVLVVAIQSNKVEFSKDGVTWQQAVLATPHTAWTN